MNLITIAGRLGSEAVLKSLPSGKEVVNFSVAVDIGRGESKQTVWVDCSLWGDRAQKLGPYLTKGKQVALAGDFNLRTFQKKDGSAGAAITCDVQRLTLMGGRETGESTEGQPQVATPQLKPSAWGAKVPAQKDEGFDSEIPF